MQKINKKKHISEDKFIYLGVYDSINRNISVCIELEQLMQTMERITMLISDIIEAGGVIEL